MAVPFGSSSFEPRLGKAAGALPPVQILPLPCCSSCISLPERAKHRAAASVGPGGLGQWPVMRAEGGRPGRGSTEEKDLEVMLIAEGVGERALA